MIISLCSGYCYLSVSLSLGSVASEQEEDAEGSSIAKDKHLSSSAALRTSKKGKGRFDHESPSSRGGFTAGVLIYSN